MKWIVLSYNLPTEPSRIRVAVWRNLKKLGAVNIQKSMWVLPYSDANYKSLSEISDQLEHNNGDALLMESSFLEEKYEKKVIEYYNAARKIEYEEIIDKCEDFFVEIQRETDRKNFTFAELEENEEELAKLLSWFTKIKDRDIFKTSLREVAESNLEKCKEVLEQFSHKVYENEK